MMIYPPSIKQLQDDLAQAPATSLTVLAQKIIQGAQQMDLHKAENLSVHFSLKNASRNSQNPPEWNDDSILGASWADVEDQPLQSGEKWNEGRRATKTGVLYEFNQKGRPINPYMNTGLNGRGVLGQFGPNHAVDNGVIVIKPDETGKPVLYALGIFRKYDNDAPAFAGGFAKFSKNSDGAYIIDTTSIIQTQMEEFFEEMISGSIELLPEYQAQLENAIQAEIDIRMQSRNGVALPDDKLHEIRDQVETALKMKQVQDKDHGFLLRLTDLIAQGHECFAGPVLNASRNTNNAWIESHLSWFLMDEENWKKVKGDHPVFDYQFTAGDDASDVVYHKVDSQLIDKAFDSHGPMFAFMAASFLLDRQKKEIVIDPDIMNQIKDIEAYLSSCFSPETFTVSQTVPVLN